MSENINKLNVENESSKDFSYGHCLNATQLFIGFPLYKLRYQAKQLHIDPEVLEFARRQLCTNIFRESARIIINDIVENDVLFVLPGALYESYIKMKVFQKEDFLRVRSKYAKFANIDPFVSNFRGYLLYLYMTKGQRVLEKPIYATKYIRDKIVKYTNSGKQYTA